MTKRLTRKKDGMIAGICAGIGEYMNVDPTVIRLAYIVLSAMSIGFPGIVAYIILWIVIPEE